MKKQIFTLLLFSVILIQCREELPVTQDFPVVITTRAIPDKQGFSFEGKLINDDGFEILMHGFIYGSKGFVRRGVGAIVYEVGNPSDETFSLKTTPIGTDPIYEYRAFVTYMENSTKKTFYGNVERIASKAEGHGGIWNLITANVTLGGSGKILTAVPRNNGAFLIQQDGKVTKFDAAERVTSEGPNFPLNGSQGQFELYSTLGPIVLNSQNNNVYRLDANNSWAIITQLPFPHENLAAGDVYINQYYPHVYIFGSFGTYQFNYIENKWETRSVFPLSLGQSIVAGTFTDQHYILTSDGKIQRYNGSSPPSLLTTFPHPINGQVFLFTLGSSWYIFNNLSELWRFDYTEDKWSQEQSFPQTLNNPVYFDDVGNGFYVVNKNTNGNYDIWIFGSSQ
jgi:hypothetical protein